MRVVRVIARRLVLRLVPGLVLAGISFVVVPPAAAQNALITWNINAADAITAGRPPASSAVLLAITQAAVFDAVSAVAGGLVPYAAHVTVTQPASVDAAVAASAYFTLIARVPSQAALLTSRYDAFLARIPDGPAKENGIAAGRQVAEAILALRSNDGFDNVVAYAQPPTGPGVWEPTAPAPAAPVDIKLRQVRPLTFASPWSFRPAGPIALTSAGYAEELAEVQALGRSFSSARTAEQTDIAWFWSENTAGQWNRVVRVLAVDRDLTVPQTARLLALANTAMADAAIACWDAKYHFNFWRPFHAVGRADADGNPATEPESGWTPLVNANHPEYPSGHACLSSAVLEVVSEFFGPKPLALTVDSLAPLAVVKTRHYSSTRQALKEVLDARVYSGLHFRNSLNEGAALGRHVAKHVSRGFFVEPSQ